MQQDSLEEEVTEVLKEVPVPGDGDCFYYALLVAVGALDAAALWEAGPRGRGVSRRAKAAATELRALFLQALERPRVRDHFRLYEGELSNLRRRLSGNEYAEDAEVKLAAVLFRLRLHVYIPSLKEDQRWATVAPDAPATYGSGLGLRRCHASDVVMRLDLETKHYTPMRWTDEACLRRLQERFLRRRHRLSAGAECAAALSGLRRAYDGVRRCARLKKEPDVVRGFLETRREALSELLRLRRALGGQPARGAGFRETLQGLCRDLERQGGRVDEAVAAAFLTRLAWRLQDSAVAAQAC